MNFKNLKGENVIELQKINKFSEPKLEYSKYKKFSNHKLFKEVSEEFLSELKIPDICITRLLEYFHQTINNFRIMHDLTEINKYKKETTSFIIYTPEEWRHYDEFISLKIKEYLQSWDKNVFSFVGNSYNILIPEHIRNYIPRNIITDSLSHYLDGEDINHLKIKFNCDSLFPKIYELYINKDSPHFTRTLPNSDYCKIPLSTANLIIFTARYLSRFYPNDLSDAITSLEIFMNYIFLEKMVSKIKVVNSGYDFMFCETGVYGDMTYVFLSIEKFLNFGFYLYENFHV